MKNLVKSISSSVGKLKTINEMPTPFKVPFIQPLLYRTKYIDEQHRKLGPIFVEKVGNVNFVFVNDAEAIRTLLLKLEGKYPQHILPETWTIYNKKHDVKRGLLFLDGEEWLQLRRKINNLILKPSTTLWIEKPIANIVDAKIKHWRRLGVSGFQPKLNDELYSISSQVMLSIMLGSKYENVQKMKDLSEEISKQVSKIFLYTNKLYFLPSFMYTKWNHPTWKAFEESVSKTLAYGKDIIDEMFTMEDKGDGLLAKMIEEKLTKDEIYRVLIDFIIAAGDTTTFTTQWTLYLLAKHRLTMIRTQKDLVKNDNTSVVNAIKESMRLYPVAAFVARILTEPSVLLDYELPPGTVVSASIFTNGRDPKYFQDPLLFQPERWNRDTDDTSKARLHGALPFAIGARSCIGKKIAMEQITQVVSKILQSFDLAVLNEKEVTEEMVMLLKPQEEIKLHFTTI